MTDETRQELTIHRDYLRRALEIATPSYERLKQAMNAADIADNDMILLSDMAHLYGYLTGGLEMVEQRLGQLPEQEPLDKYLRKSSEPILCAPEPASPSQTPSTMIKRTL